MNPPDESKARTALTGEYSMGRPCPRLHVGVVSDVDGVAFVSAAWSSGSLRTQVARYVRKEARKKLRVDEARRINELLAQGHEEAGIARYLETVSARWGPERLHRRCVRIGPAPWILP